MMTPSGNYPIFRIFYTIFPHISILEKSFEDNPNVFGFSWENPGLFPVGNLTMLPGTAKMKKEILA
jgi:hypothetical protein